MTTHPNRTLTPSRLRRILCSLFLVAAALAVLGAIASSRAIGQGNSPNQDATAETAGPSPTPPCSGQLITVLNESFDNVIPPALPAGWTATNAIDPDGIFWQTSNTGLPSPPADSPPNAAWINDPPAVSDKRLDSPGVFATESYWVTLTFRHNFNLEASNTDPNVGFDGGVLEFSIDGGATFQDILNWGSFASGGYNRTISTDRGSPIAGRRAWSGNSEGFITTTVSLPQELGNGVLRWRMASDNSSSSEGWRVDTTNVLWCHFSGTPTPTPTPGQIVLTASAHRVNGRKVVNLAWTGANSARVDIYRDGAPLARVQNTGSYRDLLTVHGLYTYKVCEAGTMNCSNEVTVRFGGP